MARSEWCCNGLSHAFAQRADRGIYVFASRLGPSSPVSFWLAMRSVTQADLRRRENLGPSSTVPVTLATRVPIRFCPWCGKRLDRFYGPNGNQLIDTSLDAEFYLPESPAPGTD